MAVLAELRKPEAGMSVIEQLIARTEPGAALGGPALLLIDPKYGLNVGNVIRAASCWGIEEVCFTGTRVGADVEGKGRLPREERMRDYREVALRHTERPFDLYSRAVPVAVEIRPGAENLLDFDHPENALYVFGPEDGTLRRNVLTQCHRFLRIPTAHCLNLAAAVNVVLYDRLAKA